MISLDRLLDGLDVEVVPLLDVAIPGSRHRRDGRDLPAPAPCAASGRTAVLELHGGAVLRLSPGGVIIQPPSRRTQVVVADAERDVVVTASVRVRITYRRCVGLFDDLPGPLVEDLAADDPIRRSLDELLDEIVEARPGYHAMVETLLRRCLILLLRRHFPRGLGPSWPAALEDARLGRAIAAMQSRPEHCFTLAELAEVAGMSRSVFAARFASALAKSPIEFLKALRLDHAAELLVRTDLPVKAVAARVGYSSRSAFTRAFVARHGRGPTRFRMVAPEPVLERQSPPPLEAA